VKYYGHYFLIIAKSLRIHSVGAMCAFSTDGARTIDLTKKGVDEPSDDPTAMEAAPRGFFSLFPGLDRRVVTLPINFSTPFMREYIMGMRCVNSDKETFRSTLAKNGSKGNALVVVVGGAAESMLVKPGCIELVLEHRRGFVREAIRAGASIVPSLAFGETDLYYVTEEEEGSLISKIQEWVNKVTGVAMPLFRGRGILLVDFGMMPLRKPIVVVVGAPIAPPKLEDGVTFDPIVDRSTQEPQNEHGKLLCEWHEKYVTALTELYDAYKDKEWNRPGKNRKQSMVIVK